jgi:hypothetical protein
MELLVLVARLARLEVQIVELGVCSLQCVAWSVGMLSEAPMMLMRMEWIGAQVEKAVSLCTKSAVSSVCSLTFAAAFVVTETSLVHRTYHSLSFDQWHTGIVSLSSKTPVVPASK